MSSQPKFDVSNLVLANRFKLGQRIGGGSFGEIYRAVSLNSGESVAVKIELAACKFPQLVFELKLYQTVNPRNDAVGIPAVYWYGREGDYNCLVMDLLGPSLEDLHSYCGRKFSFKTTMILAAQMINRLENLHNQGFIHRDIKPDNFLMGSGPRSHLVYIIDFGLAKRFREQRTLNHIPHKDGKSLTGTARYCSIHTHCGIEQSRRDDLDAVGYMLVYFLKGRLPWQELQAPNKQQRYDRIMEKKMAVSPEQLCAGIAQPEVLAYLRYCRALGFSDTPDYIGWRKVFIEALKSESLRFDFTYDWHREPLHVHSFAASPLVTMVKNHRRRLHAANTGGTRLDVTPLQQEIILGTNTVHTGDRDRRSGMGDSQYGSPRSSSQYALSSSGNMLPSDVNPTIGGNDGTRDIHSESVREEDIKYVAVVPAGHAVPMASNVLHCRFLPCEPYLIARQSLKHAYGDDSSSSSDDGGGAGGAVGGGGVGVAAGGGGGGHSTLNNTVGGK